VSNPNLISFGHIIPELTIGGTAILLFLLSAVARVRTTFVRFLLSSVAGAGLLVSLVILLWPLLQSADSGQPNQKLFWGLLVTDPLSIFFRGLAMAATFFTVILSIGSPSLEKKNQGEYLGLLLVFAMGLCLLAAANNLLMIYVAMETVSLCSYILTGWDSRYPRSKEAGLKYVLYGGVASGVMLFGISLLYGLFGDLSLPGLHQAIVSNLHVINSDIGQWAILFAIILVIGGFGFKIAAVPFHMWCPDAYQGAPTPFTALLSVGPKAAGFALILRFFYSLFASNLEASTTINVPWVMILGIISAITMTIGNLSAVTQNNLKRLLAYSSIAHAGYMLMGVVAGGQTGFESVSLYMLVYVFMNMGAFAIVSAVDRITGSEEIEDYRGLGKRFPMMGVIMAIFLFSLAGLPPTAGFIGKLYLFSALIQRGDFWFYALAIVGIVNAVISLYYYARVLKAMYFSKPEEDSESSKISSFSPALGLAFFLAIPTLVLGIFWHPLALVVEWSARIFH
jgi:NADH-quinone oxidoreductase subunit N